MPKRVLDVGNCYADHSMIRTLIESKFDATVESADTFDAALDRLRGDTFDLVLVNRLFDVDSTEGISLIKQVKEDPTLKAIPCMLISNYEDQQERAVEAGAELGFGKSQLQAPLTTARLQEALESGVGAS